MTFNESNTVEAFIRDRLKSIGWEFIDHNSLPRQPQDVLVEEHLRDALVRLNPTIAERPERADEVLYRLRAAIMTVRDTGLVKANEEFAAWLFGERSMPFGENGEHVTIRLIDFDDPNPGLASRTASSSPSSSRSVLARPRSGPTSCYSSTECRW